MADTKISDLTELTSASTDDLLAIADDPSGTPASKKITVDNFQGSLTKVGKVTVTQPASASTITVADGKVLTVNKTLTLDGSDATTLTFPTTSQNIVGVSESQTLTNKTIDGGDNTLTNIATSSLTATGADASVVSGTAGTSGNIVQWNADGDAVDGGIAVANVIDTSDTATTSASGIVELATAAETTTGTDATRAVTPDGLAGSVYGEKAMEVTAFDYTTDTATGDGAAYFTIPSSMDGWNLVSGHVRVITAGTTGTTDVQLHNVTKAQDFYSTKITIDSTETGSDTAATPAVINTATDDVSSWDLCRVDVDAIHSGTAAKGMICTFIFRAP